MQRLFATNVLSGVRFTRHYGPRMRDKGFGRIVFISSESGVQIPTEMIHYGFTKSADLALMRGFAVLPGPTRAEGVEAMFKSMGRSLDDPKVERSFIDSARPSSIIKRLARPEEVAEVVAFLCSREASAMTGSPVRADGGVVLSITWPRCARRNHYEGPLFRARSSSLPANCLSSHSRASAAAFAQVGF